MTKSDPPPGLLPRLQDFEALWYLSKQIGDGGQGEIFQTFPKPNNKHYAHQPQRVTADSSQPSLFVTKIIQFNEPMRALQRIIKCYLFVHKQKLLLIYGIYHDLKRKQILIVLQRLSHELDTQYLIHSPTMANLRFARPGYLYINHERSIQTFIKQIASQLNTIHSHHRIHFDLKPSNIMFNAVTSEWCIIDYDLMKRTKCTNDVNNEICIKHYRGTQSWTSPEMSTRSNATNPSVITNKTDIFSFGLIIIYIVECGFQPYLLEEKDVAEVHCKELVSSVTWRRDKVYFDKLLRGGNGNRYLQRYLDEMNADYLISDGLHDLLKNMLIFEVKKRLNVSQVLRHPWLNS